MATLPPMAMCFTLKVPPLLAKVSYSLAGVARVVTMRPYISVRGGILILLTGLNGRRSPSKDSVPGVNAKGNQDTSGNAATATVQTARTINESRLMVLKH